METDDPPAAVVAPLAEPAPNTVLFDGPLNDEMGGRLLTGIKKAVDEKTPELTILINSPGGQLDVMFDVFDSIRAAERLGVRTKCVVPDDSMAASAAALIFEACTERLVSPTAHLMFHKAATMAMGNSSALERAAESLDDADHQIAVWVAPRMHMTADEYYAWVGSHQRWLGAAEAIKAGAADGVLK